jgi:plasmid maintenance system killer protein
MRTGTLCLPADEVGKIRRILSYLEAAEKPQALNLLGYRFHQLKGEYRGFYSVTVTGTTELSFGLWTVMLLTLIIWITIEENIT